MSLRLPVQPGAVLYDAHKDKIIVYSGHIIDDDGFGQPAMFCHDKQWNDNARVSKGVIYTGWVAKKYLYKLGDL